jgi:hypothetical protein
MNRAGLINWSEPGYARFQRAVSMGRPIGGRLRLNPIEIESDRFHLLRFLPRLRAGSARIQARPMYFAIYWAHQFITSQ